MGHLPVPVNKFDVGKPTLGVSHLKVEVGGFVDALFNLSVENMANLKSTQRPTSTLRDWQKDN